MYISVSKQGVLQFFQFQRMKLEVLVILSPTTTLSKF